MRRRADARRTLSVCSEHLRSAVVAALALTMLLLTAACNTGKNPLAGEPTSASATSTGSASDQRLIVAEFADHADLNGVEAIDDWGERGRVITERLQARATASQGEARKLAAGAGVEATSYWITNVLVFAGDAELVERVRRLPGVDQVYVEPLHPRTGVPAFRQITDVAGVPWNISAVGAPAAWSAGRTGSGAVIGVIDTGVEVQHPALVSSWRRDNGWFDATDECPGPCDPVGHGTHVIGAAVGGDGTGALPAIGVAPGASFVAAKACTAEGCRETDVLESAQWMLAPGGRPGDRPTVLLNAWDLASNDTSLDQLPDVWRAAGQVPVFAAGNNGPGCATIGAPANQSASTAVGALQRDSTIAPSSSRGPGPSPGPKPDLWAPGVDIISSLPGGTYGLGSGTSMAAPHVAGALALVLGSGTDTKRAVEELERTATRLEGSRPCAARPSATSTAAGGSTDPDQPRALKVS